MCSLACRASRFYHVAKKPWQREKPGLHSRLMAARAWWVLPCGVVASLLGKASAWSHVVHGLRGAGFD